MERVSWVVALGLMLIPFSLSTCPQTMQGEGPQLLLSEAVSRAAKAAGARPLTSPESLSRDLEAPEVQESYRQQVPPLCSRIGMVYWEGLGQVPAS